IGEDRDGESLLLGFWELNTDLFDAPTIERAIVHFGNLLAGATADPERTLAELPLLAAAERAQLLTGWNATAMARPRGRLIHELFEAQAARTPLAVAVSQEGESLTYGELSARSSRLAHCLRHLGVGPEVRVGLCVERTPEMVVALLGILKAGGAYVPLDPAHPTERLALIVADAEPAVLVTEERWLAVLPPHGARTLCLDRDREAIAAGSAAAPPRTTEDESLAYVIYTSGSTGRPKGVQLPHRAVVNFLLAMAGHPGLRAGDVVPALTTLTFDIAGLEVYLPLAVGARIEVVRRDDAADGALLAARLRASGATALQATPATWRLLLDAGWDGLPGLKALCGGEALPRELAAALLPRVEELWNVYGPTETAIWSAAGPVAGGDGPVLLGTPIANTAFYVVDRDLAPVPVGVSGELWIAGDGVARGYLGRPDLTAEKFIPDPFAGEPGARLYRTGDLVRWRPAGELEFLGRLDHQVKVRGFRIELGEIEAVLGQHPSVKAVVMAAVGARQGDKSLVAYVVLDEGQPAEILELRRFLADKLPAYMVPASFMILDALPLTANGKVDRSALPLPGAAARPVAASGRLGTPVVELLAGIWEEVLGLDGLGADEDFFAAGGNSLLATQVVSRIRAAFEIELPLRALFEEPTVDGLAAAVESLLAGGRQRQAPPIVPVPRAGDQPLSFGQERLWFLDQLDPGSATYNLPLALGLRGDLSRPALAASLSAMVARHEGLRSTFLAVDGTPMQRTSPARPLTLPLIDLSALPRANRDAAAAALTQEEAARPFDLQRGPLLRAALLRLEPELHVALFTMHHIVSDGWSMGVVIREVGEVYSALCQGRPFALPALPVQYGDFALWQRAWLSEEVLAEQLAFWRQRLAGAPMVLDLPLDRPRLARRSPRRGHVAMPLAGPLARELAALGRRSGATLFMVLLAAFQALLSRLSGQVDLIVGSPVANRNRAETEGLIGFFANNLALRAELADDPAGAVLVARARETALAAYAYQDLPFEKLVEELAPERSLAHSPIFQVVLVMQDAPFAALELPALTLEPVAVRPGDAKFDITLTFAQTDAGLAAAWDYSPSLFDRATVERLAGGFIALAAGMAERTASRVSELPLLSGAQRHQVAVEWAARRSLEEAGLDALFTAQAERSPEAVAVVCGGASLTYGELESRSNQLARHLRHLGVEVEDRVGLCVERSLDLVVGMLGILKAGAAYVPLDPGYPVDRLAFMVADAGIARVVTQELLAGLVAGAGVDPAGIVRLDADAAAIGRSPAAAPRSGAGPQNLAYVIYTSGSTGRPKGSLVTHGNVTRLFAATREWFGFGPDDVWTLFHSYAFDFSVWEVWGALLYGGRLVVVPWEVSRAPESFQALLVREGVTVLNQTPSAFRALQPSLERAAGAGSLRWVIFGG
ncbi:MAG TPA: amino acid adenylation domain-containing protein, partial [Thermoanaerobaculia bacterium]|nr:amino acid adenylation domain-containing protein [Thermoanaerobaculia bacterium]